MIIRFLCAFILYSKHDRDHSVKKWPSRCLNLANTCCLNFFLKNICSFRTILNFRKKSLLEINTEEKRENRIKEQMAFSLIAWVTNPKKEMKCNSGDTDLWNLPHCGDRFWKVELWYIYNYMFELLVRLMLEVNSKHQILLRALCYRQKFEVELVSKQNFYSNTKNIIHLLAM